MSNILVFGDSITWGANDWEKGGWVEHLKVYLGKNYDSIVYNLGIDGEKTPTLLARFEPEIKPRTEEGLETIIIFAVGINDSYFVHSKNDNVIKFEDFKKNIENLIVLARKFSSKIIFIGLTPVDETETTPIPWDADKSYKNEYVKKYNDFISYICKDKNIFFIDILNDWLKKDYKILLDDGLHPNSKGHEKIFETVKEYLIQNKIINPSSRPV